MEVFQEKYTGFRLLVGNTTDEGFKYSKHKVSILLIYFLSFILIFYHFSNIPLSQEIACSDAKALGNNCNFSSPLGSIAIFFYIYITFIALYSLTKKGEIPKYNITGISRRKLVVSLLLFLFFGSLIIGIIFVLSIFLAFGVLVFGYSLYIIWLLLEPFLLLGGILGMMDIITRDYPIKGYGTRTKIFILFNIIIALIGSSLILRAEKGSGSNDYVNFLDYQFYRPAFEALSNSFRTLVSITLLTILIWFLLDRFREKSERREYKKGVLPWLFLIAMILAAISIIPVMISTEGALVEFTSITDLFTLFLAIILGVWRVLEVSKSEEVIKGWEKVNPIKLLTRIDPYTKALFLFSLSMIAFFATLQSGTEAAISQTIDETKVQKMGLLASLFGLAYIAILLRYNQTKSEKDGILKRIQQRVLSKN